MVFKDRREAGKLLARAIVERFNGTLKDPVVVAIPRGGVVVAEPIALQLSAPLELVIPRKVGAPFNPEFAVAAVTEDGTLILNPDLSPDALSRLGVTEEYLKRKALEEIGDKAAEAPLHRRQAEDSPYGARRYTGRRRHSNRFNGKGCNSLPEEREPQQDNTCGSGYAPRQVGGV